jgi:protein-S-isoprenylcysteine O-methyltransferase Ste14
MTGILHDGDEPSMIPERFFSNLLSCVWCFSMWTSTGWLICWFVLPEIIIWLAMPFAMSALVILLDKFISK